MSCVCNKGFIYCHCGVAEIWRDAFERVKDRPSFTDLIPPPPIPEEARTCGFCTEPCGNDHCCMKDE